VGHGVARASVRLVCRQHAPLKTREKEASGTSAHTESLCTEYVCTQRCWPKSQRRMVWSDPPDRHSVPVESSANVLTFPEWPCGRYPDFHVTADGKQT